MTTVIDNAPRCRECRRQLAIAVARPWVIDCPRCKARNESRDVVLT